MTKKALQLGNAITAGVNPCSNEKTPRTVKRYYQENKFYSLRLFAMPNQMGKDVSGLMISKHFATAEVHLRCTIHWLSWPPSCAHLQ